MGSEMCIRDSSGVSQGARNFYTGNIKSYIDAVQKFLSGEHAFAKAEFERLVRDVDPEGEERHVHSAATKQLQQFAKILSLPEDPAVLQAMIDGYSNETDGLKLLQGEKVLQTISSQFGRNSKYAEICKSAAAQLIVIQRRLAGNSDDDE